MSENEVTDMVSGFAKANPEIVARLRAAAIEMLDHGRQELTATEFKAAQIAFCLGGVWAIINQVNTQDKSDENKESY